MIQVAAIAIRHPTEPNLFLHGLRTDNRLWSQPGGHFKPGETPSEAAKRELKEEIGLEIPLKEVKSKRIGDILVHLFVGDMPEDQAIDFSADPDKEFTTVKFLDPSLHPNMHIPKDRNLLVSWMDETIFPLKKAPAPFVPDYDSQFNNGSVHDIIPNEKALKAAGSTIEESQILPNGLKYERWLSKDGAEHAHLLYHPKQKAAIAGALTTPVIGGELETRYGQELSDRQDHKVTASKVSGANKGKGYGKMLYSAMLAHFIPEGKSLWSDDLVSPQAQKLWHSFRNLHGVSGYIGFYPKDPYNYDPNNYKNTNNFVTVVDKAGIQQSDKHFPQLADYHHYKDNVTTIKQKPKKKDPDQLDFLDADYDSRKLAASEANFTDLQELSKAPQKFPDASNDPNWHKAYDVGQTKRQLPHARHTVTKKDDHYHHVLSTKTLTRHIISDLDDPHADNPISSIDVFYDPEIDEMPQIQSAIVSKDHRGYGWGEKTYLNALKHHKNLMSDVVISPQSNAIYNKLANHPDVTAKLGAYPSNEPHRLKYTPKIEKSEEILFKIESDMGLFFANKINKNDNNYIQHMPIGTPHPETPHVVQWHSPGFKAYYSNKDLSQKDDEFVNNNKEAFLSTVPDSHRETVNKFITSIQGHPKRHALPGFDQKGKFQIWTPRIRHIKHLLSNKENASMDYNSDGSVNFTLGMRHGADTRGTSWNYHPKSGLKYLGRVSKNEDQLLRSPKRTEPGIPGQRLDKSIRPVDTDIRKSNERNAGRNDSDDGSVRPGGTNGSGPGGKTAGKAPNPLRVIKAECKETDLCADINHDIFDENCKLNQAVRLKLVQVYNDIKDDLTEKGYNFEPDFVILTGSLLGPNWDSQSDLDFHIGVDFKELGLGDSFNDYLRLYAKDFNSNKYKIKGKDLELYFQDAKEKHDSPGIYDLLNDHWIKPPSNEKIIITDEMKATAKDYLDKATKMLSGIDDLKTEVEVRLKFNEIKTFFNQIKAMRKKSMLEEGEKSFGNQVFKQLRRNGTLELLSDSLGKLQVKLYDVFEDLDKSRARITVEPFSADPKWFDPKKHDFVIKYHKDDEPVGILAVTHKKDGIMPYQMNVQKDYRRSGIASKMANHAERISMKNLQSSPDTTKDFVKWFTAYKTPKIP